MSAAMKLDDKDAAYYQGLNGWLLRAVPGEARDILEVGCAEGRLGAALKQDRPDRQVFGIERDPAVAARAAQNLDRVFTLDVEENLPEIAEGSLDLILFGDVLEHLRDPLATVRRYRRLLRPTGRVLVCVPNIQYHAVLRSLLRGDFQYQEQGILDETHLRFFTYASFQKLLLDAGLQPNLLDHVFGSCPPPFFQALLPALQYLGVDPVLAQIFLGSHQYIVEGRPLGWDETSGSEAPLSFIVCVNDEEVLRDNLLSSPCLRGATPHQIIEVRDASSAAEAFEAGLTHAVHPMAVLVHQDVYLPAGWPGRFARQVELAQRRHPGVGVFGVYGVRAAPGSSEGLERLGHVVDRFRLLRDGGELPAQVDALDEVLLAFPRDTPLRLDAALGFHNYGTDVVLQAASAGLEAVALDAPCFHNSLLGVGKLSEAFGRSQAHLRARWTHRLPLATNNGLVT